MGLAVLTGRFFEQLAGFVGEDLGPTVQRTNPPSTSNYSLGPDQGTDGGGAGEEEPEAGEPGGDLPAPGVVAHGSADLAVHRLQLAGGLGGEGLAPAVG